MKILDFFRKVGILRTGEDVDVMTTVGDKPKEEAPVSEEAPSQEAPAQETSESNQDTGNQDKTVM